MTDDGGNRFFHEALADSLHLLSVERTWDADEWHLPSEHCDDLTLVDHRLVQSPSESGVAVLRPINADHNAERHRTAGVNLPEGRPASADCSSCSRLRPLGSGSSHTESPSPSRQTRPATIPAPPYPHEEANMSGIRYAPAKAPILPGAAERPCAVVR